jgi:hypothetical protein
MLLILYLSTFSRHSLFPVSSRLLPFFPSVRLVHTRSIPHLTTPGQDSGNGGVGVFIRTLHEFLETPETVGWVSSTFPASQRDNPLRCNPTVTSLPCHLYRGTPTTIPNHANSAATPLLRHFYCDIFAVTPRLDRSRLFAFFLPLRLFPDVSSETSTAKQRKWWCSPAILCSTASAVTFFDFSPAGSVGHFDNSGNGGVGFSSFSRVPNSELCPNHLRLLLTHRLDRQQDNGNGGVGENVGVNGNS